MTTESAVINRLGVALAADSAVTIMGYGAPKVFNTGDKLFELRYESPIGIMVYGNLDYLSVPWEIIIKDFRNSKPTPMPTTMAEWSRAFIDFLKGHRVLSSTQSDAYTDLRARKLSMMLHGNVDLSVRTHLQTNSDLSMEALRGFFDEHLTRMEKSHEQQGNIESLSDLTVAEVSDTCSVNVSSAIISMFKSNGWYPIPSKYVSRLTNVVYQSLLKDTDDDFTTGIVISGFAGDDLFPSLHAFTVDGVICGRPRHLETHNVSISLPSFPPDDKGANLGTAISFAQKEVVDRLLKGADDRVIDGALNYINTLPGFIGFIMKTEGYNVTDGGGKPVSLELLVERFRAPIANQFLTNVNGITQNLLGAFNQTISSMPKQELVELAEALVSITAVERRASSDPGTVGGPIDVALITKSEGFVWIKRKHHFRAELNPRYMARTKAVTQEGESE